ncbi:MAG: alpha/beta hydrolase [Rhodospirillales bacterium]|nr:alpha/beta hydrolase [Rhodospirillales bacterium]
MISPIQIDWEQVDCPVQLIWAVDDRVVKMPAAESMPPRLDLHLIEVGGHLPHIMASDRVNRLLGNFIRAQTPHVSNVAAQE